MLPTYERLNASKTLIRIPFGKIAIAVVSLPLGSFIFCVIWSVLFDFERSTATHCDVRNFLPSISAAIGNYEPQRTVWRMAIFLHLPGRLAVAKMYWDYYRDSIRRDRRALATFACMLNVIEDFALLSLSVWTSADNYEIHRNSFIVFIVCSEFYMLITLHLNRSGRSMSRSPIEEKSLVCKRNLFILNIASFLLASYFFIRHNSKCEPGIYTLFALFEYVLVLTNMGYHMTAFWDFYAFNVILDREKRLHLSHF